MEADPQPGALGEGPRRPGLHGQAVQLRPTRAPEISQDEALWAPPDLSLAGACVWEHDLAGLSAPEGEPGPRQERPASARAVAERRDSRQTSVEDSV